MELHLDRSRQLEVRRAIHQFRQEPGSLAMAQWLKARMAKLQTQLVSANFMAAALIQHLYVLWKMERPKFDKEAIGHLPHRINQNLSKYTTVTKGK